MNWITVYRWPITHSRSFSMSLTHTPNNRKRSPSPREKRPTGSTPNKYHIYNTFAHWWCFYRFVNFPNKLQFRWFEYVKLYSKRLVPIWHQYACGQTEQSKAKVIKIIGYLSIFTEKYHVSSFCHLYLRLPFTYVIPDRTRFMRIVYVHCSFHFYCPCGIFQSRRRISGPKMIHPKKNSW